MVSGPLFLKGIIDMAHNVMSPVHFYVYDYANKQSFNAFFGPCPKHLGVTHGDELTSLFESAGRRLCAPDEAVSKLVVDIWTYFAVSEYGLSYVITGAGIVDPQKMIRRPEKIQNNALKYY